MAIKVGTSASETINGTAVGDTISGKGGNDILSGLGAGDTLYGGGGDDTLIGGAGKDTLWGGEGSDTFKYLARSDSRGTTIDLIGDFRDSTGSGGIVGDVVDLTALGTAVVESKYYAGYSGLQAVFSYNSATGLTTLSYYQGSSTPVFQVNFTGQVSYDDPYWDLNAGENDPNFLGIRFSTSPTAGDDVLSSTAGLDNLNAAGGNDVIFSDAGDKFHGGAGDDEFHGGGSLYGDAGSDTIYPSDSADRIFGGTGDDFIDFGLENGYGFTGQIDGGDGRDEVFEFYADTVNAFTGQWSGGAISGIEVYAGGISHFIGSNASESVYNRPWYGDVTFVGNGGDDYVLLGEGNNRAEGGAGNDTIDGGGIQGNIGTDTAVFSGNHTDYVISVTQYDPFTSTTTVQQIGGGGDGTDTLNNVEFLEFADGTFKITDFVPPPVPTEGNDFFVGTDGNDTIDLLGGNDTYYGIGGNDTVAGGNGGDTIDGGDGNDNLSGGNGTDTIYGGAGIDILNGGAEDDNVHAGDGADTLYGGDGNDFLSGDAGDDFVYGQLGDDGIRGGEGTDHLDGGGGYDTAFEDAFGTTHADYGIVKNPDGTIIVTDTNPADSYDGETDFLVGVEAIRFNDGLYEVSTGIFYPSETII